MQGAALAVLCCARGRAAPGCCRPRCQRPTRHKEADKRCHPPSLHHSVAFRNCLLPCTHPRIKTHSHLKLTYARAPAHPPTPLAGRRGKTGLATTLINKNQSESILLDLKHLLREAKQRIPPVLQALEDPMDQLKAGRGGGAARAQRGRSARSAGGWLG